MQGSPASGCRHESLHPEPHASPRGSGLDREENAQARSRSRPLPQHRRPSSKALFNTMQGSPGAGADMNPCAQNCTLPLVGAVLTAKKMHRRVRGRDRSHGTGDFSGSLFNTMQGSPASGCRHESLRPEPHFSPRGSGLDREESAPARSRSRPLPRHRRLFLGPCSIPCRAHRPAGADMSPCTPNRTPPLVGAVLTAKKTHRHVRGRDRSHGTGDFFWAPVQYHAGLTGQRVPT